MIHGLVLHVAMQEISLCGCVVIPGLICAQFAQQVCSLTRPQSPIRLSQVRLLNPAITHTLPQ